MVEFSANQIEQKLKKMKEFESPEVLYDELIASVRKYHPSAICYFFEHHLCRCLYRSRYRS